MPKPSDLLQGTLDLLILKTLARGSLHGWAISKRIGLLSNDVLAVQQGSLYPALHRLEQQGWIEAEWKGTDQGRSVAAIPGGGFVIGGLTPSPDFPVPNAAQPTFGGSTSDGWVARIVPN